MLDTKSKYIRKKHEEKNMNMNASTKGKLSNGIQLLEPQDDTERLSQLNMSKFLRIKYSF